MDDEGSLRISGLVTIILVTVLLGFSVTTTSSEKNVNLEEHSTAPVGFLNLTSAFHVGLAVGLVGVTYFIWINTTRKRNKNKAKKIIK